MTSNWYWRNGSTTHGPIDSAELRRLARDGVVHAETCVRKQGNDDWIPAPKIKNLLPDVAPVGPKFVPPPPIVTAARASKPNQTEVAINVAKQHASEIVAELRTINFRDEVLPFNDHVMKRLINDTAFIPILILGSLPLFIASLDSQRTQLAAFSMFFAVMWGVVFKTFIVPISGQWKLLIAAFLSTGVVGIAILKLASNLLLFGSVLTMLSTATTATSLLAEILLVGIPEELCKALPVLAFIYWKRENVDPILAVLVGVFSGLGFAAFENVGYGEWMAIVGTILRDSRIATTNSMMRVISASFCHAIFAGTSAYFLSTAALTGRRRATLLVLGIGTAAVLHGAYNTLVDLDPMIGGMWVVVSFVLFYSYLTKLRTQNKSPE